MSHRATSSQEWQCDLHLPETAALIAEGNTGLTLVTLTGPLHVHIHVEGRDIGTRSMAQFSSAASTVEFLLFS